MQKKLLALAVAGALVPAAAIAQSSVEIYGRANLGIDNYRASGATTGSGIASRNRIYDSGSRLGFRVNEALGGGLRAFVVMESGVNIDDGGTTGQHNATNASSGTWASRDSYVGLGGGWGDVRFGRQSIYWSNGVIAQTGANYINTAADGITSSAGILGAPVTRQSDVISYNSPTFGGFNVSLSYSPSDQEAASAYNDAPGTDRGNIMGITGRYTSGALRAQADFARRSNVSNVEGADNTGMKFGLGWAYATGSQISFILGRNQAESSVAGTDLRQRFHLVNWEHMMGQWQLMAQYGWTNDISGTGPVTGDNTSSKAYTLAAKYFLSKRTGVYASFNQIRNDDNQIMDYVGGAYTSVAPGALPPGADPRVIAVGVQHNF